MPRSRRLTPLFLAFLGGLSSCGQPEPAQVQEEQLHAVSEATLDEVDFAPVFIGRVNFKYPMPGIIDAAHMDALRADLTKANRGLSPTFRFLKCEAVGALPETKDNKQCGYLVDPSASGYQDGASFEFLVLSFDRARNELCMTDVPGCAPHQAVRVAGWNRGVQRSALYVSGEPLPTLAFVQILPREKEKPQEPFLVPAGKMAFVDGIRNKVGEFVGAPGEPVHNLLALSAKWEKVTRDKDLVEARWDAGRTVFFGWTALNGLGTAANAAAPLLARGTAVCRLVVAKAVWGMVVGTTGAWSSVVEVLQLRKHRDMLPAGSDEWRRVNLAIAVANAGTLFNVVDLGANLGPKIMKGAFRTLAHFRVMSEVARFRNTTIKALPPEVVAQWANQVDSEFARIVDYSLDMPKAHQPATTATQGVPFLVSKITSKLRMAAGKIPFGKLLSRPRILCVTGSCDFGFMRFIREAGRLHEPIDNATRIKVIKDVPIDDILSAPGHKELRNPAAVKEISEIIRKSHLERNDFGAAFVSGKEPIILGVYTNVDESGHVWVRAVECLDGNHRLAGGLHSGVWKTIDDIPEGAVQIRVNGWNSSGQAFERWIPYDIAAHPESKIQGWWEVQGPFVKGRTAAIPGGVASIDSEIPQQFRGVRMFEVLKRSFERIGATLGGGLDDISTPPAHFLGLAGGGLVPFLPGIAGKITETGKATANRQTVLKLRPVDSAQLADGEKCVLAKNKTIGFRSRWDAGSQHLALDVDVPTSDCPTFAAGRTIYVFVPHFNFAAR